MITVSALGVFLGLPDAVAVGLAVAVDVAVGFAVAVDVAVGLSVGIPGGAAVAAAVALGLAVAVGGRLTVAVGAAGSRASVVPVEAAGAVNPVVAVAVAVAEDEAPASSDPVFAVKMEPTTIPAVSSAPSTASQTTHFWLTDFPEVSTIGRAFVDDITAGVCSTMGGGPALLPTRDPDAESPPGSGAGFGAVAWGLGGFGIELLTSLTVERRFARGCVIPEEGRPPESATAGRGVGDSRGTVSDSSTETRGSLGREARTSKWLDRAPSRRIASRKASAD